MRTILQLPWNWAPSVLVGFGVWTLAYFLAIGPIRRRLAWGPTVTWLQQLAFHSATLVGFIALLSPLDELGDEYLFSAHMVQHILLMFIAAPLWVLGTPGWLLERITPKWAVHWVNRVTQPMVAFLIFTIVMWVWHAPALYNLALDAEWVHIVEHLMFMAAAVIGWWPVAGQSVQVAARPPLPIRILYLFLLAIPCTALAAVLTFARQPLYPFYLSAPRIFGLTAIADQQLGGLLMWLPTHLVFLLALSLTFFRWYSSLGGQPNEGVVSKKRFLKRYF